MLSRYVRYRIRRSSSSAQTKQIRQASTHIARARADKTKRGNHAFALHRIAKSKIEEARSSLGDGEARDAVALEMASNVSERRPLGEARQAA